MPAYLDKKSKDYPIYGLMAASGVVLFLMAFYNWMISLISFLFFLIIFILFFKWRKREINQLEDYIKTLSFRVRKVSEGAILEMPIGIMLVNEEYEIEWCNPFLLEHLEKDSLIGESLYDVWHSLIPIMKQGTKSEIVHMNDRCYKVFHHPEERVFYFFDITDQVEIEKMYKDEKTVIGIIYLDNYDEIAKGLNDQKRSILNSLVTSIINKWANEYGIYIKRISLDSFLAVFNESILRELENNKFSILDDVRESTSKRNVPITLSIGIGTGAMDLPELGAIAQSSLDLALGRGGDQVAIKVPNGKVKFYGGKTNPVEKRTRVRARVISHALKEIILESDKVIIMGHKIPDMDSIGSSIGIYKMAQINNREAYIVVNFKDIGPGVKRLMGEIEKDEKIYSHFISPEHALEIVTDDTLLVIVDTHKPSMVIEKELIKSVDHIVVIDHHRRGEEFIDNSLLVYMEPYASSTAELVTELLEYQQSDEKKLSMIEATALLAGIFVDTKGFTLRTGSRTFDAASYLKEHGADTVLVQKFLKEDIETYITKAKIIETVYFYDEGIAIAKGNDHEMIDQVLIAQAADTLLTMDGINASFVLSKRSENMVGISARSLGEINVQLIMEKLNGGGHLTNAATQLYGVTMEEAEKQLHEAIDEYLEGRNQA